MSMSHIFENFLFQTRIDKQVHILLQCPGLQGENSHRSSVSTNLSSSHVWDAGQWSKWFLKQQRETIFQMSLIKHSGNIVLPFTAHLSSGVKSWYNHITNLPAKFKSLNQQINQYWSTLDSLQDFIWNIYRNRQYKCEATF